MTSTNTQTCPGHSHHATLRASNLSTARNVRRTDIYGEPALIGQCDRCESTVAVAALSESGRLVLARADRMVAAGHEAEARYYLRRKALGALAYARTC